MYEIHTSPSITTVPESLLMERAVVETPVPRRGMLPCIAATDMGLAATTLAAIAGHADPATTFRLYARDARDERTMVADVLQRAAGAGVGA